MSESDFLIESQQQGAVSLLQELPRLAFNKNLQTNYLDSNKVWHVNPTAILFEIKTLINQADRRFNNKQYIQASTCYRKAKLLHEHEQHFYPQVKLHLNVALGISLYRLGGLKDAIPMIENSTTQVGRILTREDYLKFRPINYLSLNPEFNQSLTNKFINRRLRTRLYLLLCILKAQTDKHKQAYDLAYSALKGSYLLTAELLAICINKYLRANHSMSAKGHSLARRRFFSTIEDSIPKQTKQQNLKKLTLIKILLKLLQLQKQFKKQNSSKNITNIICQQLQTLKKFAPDFQNVLQIESNRIVHQQDELSEQERQLLQAKVIDIVQFKTFNPSNIHSIKSVQIERERVAEVAVLMSISCYCLSTQSRFLATETIGTQLSEGEHWLSKTMEICHGFIPNSTVFSQVYTLYQSLHAVQIQSIPEDQLYQQTCQVKVLKPLDPSSCLKICAPLVIRKLRCIPKKQEGMPEDPNAVCQDRKHFKRNIIKKQQQLARITNIYTKQFNISKFNRSITQRNSSHRYRGNTIDYPIDSMKTTQPIQVVSRSLRVKKRQNLILPQQRDFLFTRERYSGLDNIRRTLQLTQLDKFNF